MQLILEHIHWSAPDVCTQRRNPIFVRALL
jgi:hypothetical protein